MYLSCCKFFIRRFAAIPGEMPIPPKLVATGFLEEAGSG